MVDDSADARKGRFYRVDLCAVPFSHRPTGFWWATDAASLGSQVLAALEVNRWLAATVTSQPAEAAPTANRMLAIWPGLLEMFAAEFCGGPVTTQVYGTPADPEGRMAARAVCERFAAWADGRIEPAPGDRGLDVWVGDADGWPAARVLFWTLPPVLPPSKEYLQ